MVLTFCFVTAALGFSLAAGSSTSAAAAAAGRQGLRLCRGPFLRLRAPEREAAARPPTLATPDMPRRLFVARSRAPEAAGGGQRPIKAGASYLEARRRSVLSGGRALGLALLSSVPYSVPYSSWAAGFPTELSGSDPVEADKAGEKPLGKKGKGRTEFPMELGESSSSQSDKSGGFPLELGGGGEDSAPAPSTPAPRAEKGPPKGEPKMSFAPSQKQEPSAASPPPSAGETNPAAPKSDAEPVKRKNRKAKRQQVVKSEEAEAKLLQASLEDLEKRAIADTPYRRAVVRVYTRILDYNTKSAGVRPQAEIDASRERMLDAMKSFESQYSKAFLSPAGRDPSVKIFQELIEIVTDRLEQQGPQKPLDLDLERVTKFMNGWEEGATKNEQDFLKFLDRASFFKGGNLEEFVRGNRVKETWLGKFIRDVGLDTKDPNEKFTWLGKLLNDVGVVAARRG
eukprot:CAMPEP_0114515776 /NCGR_PEP_ID=MMETSP0109-20121206/16946_1 /TAXON_ID=29199 /ORGANISM="Chlorarachnion reptans, Strain CCCM449" /LENGTH=454 /DNA_ID=CAMNT_0001696063 /DNA_START=73 /DNA_END=1437 /DNA_ORIENTATION=+